MVKLYIIAFTATGIINSVEIEKYQDMESCTRDLAIVARMERNIQEERRPDDQGPNPKTYTAGECVQY